MHTSRPYLSLISALFQKFFLGIALCLLPALLIATEGLAIELKSYDYTDLTPEEIEEIKAQRHAFFEAHTAGRADAIQEHELTADRVDGNQDDYDVRYYGIHLSLNFGGQSVAGYVDYRLESRIQSLGQIDLNLRNELSVDSVIVAGNSTTFSHLSHLLSVDLPTTYNSGEVVSMQVYYHGVPYYDGSAGLDFTSDFGTEMCWTKNTPYRSRYWWPCKDYPTDKPDSIDFYMEFPNQYDIATNGVQMSVTDLGNGRKIEHWRHRYPISTYNVAFCVAEYTKFTQDWIYESDTIDFYTYSLPDNGSAMGAFQAYGPDALTVLSNLYGVYPFVTEKMGHADFGWSGAMEHQTFCMYNPYFHTDWVIVHETAHQWWGDMITCATFNHIWINEGFASYSESLYFEEKQGTAAYHNYMQTQKYLGPGSIYVENLVYSEIYHSGLSYDKGSWVLHMLRGVLGDSLFFQAILDFANSEYRFGGATTEDFAEVVSASVGEDISWFTDEWIYGEGHPVYEYGWKCVSDGIGGYDLSLFIIQMQSYPTTYTMPTKTEIQTTGGQVDTTLWNDDAFILYTIPLSDSATSIALDPDEWILRETSEVPFGLKVTTRSLPDAPENEFYSQTLHAIGGEEPYTWSFFGGDLPYGMAFDAPSATISGTPTFQATYYFTITCEDSSNPPLADTIGYSVTVTPPPGICGDADDNGAVAITDAVYIINYIFGGGPAPTVGQADVDCSGQISITDAVYIINYIFGGGPAPCAACP